jgi:hypothetical protein
VEFWLKEKKIIKVMGYQWYWTYDFKTFIPHAGFFDPKEKGRREVFNNVPGGDTILRLGKLLEKTLKTNENYV